ncbi:MAG: hypothetical protein WC833_03045 [Bacteroidales bacterium]|jgi:hypothetical protein
MSRKTIFRIILIILLSATAVLICIQLSFTLYFNNRIKTALLDEVVKQTGQKYDVKIAKLNTNLFRQSIFISGFIMKPLKNNGLLLQKDSTLQNSSDTQKYFFTAKRINFINFGVFSYIFRKNLKISRMVLESPSGKIYRSRATLSKHPKGELPEDPKTMFSIYHLFSKKIHSLKINSIQIINADIAVFDDYTDIVPSIVSNENELNILNLRIDKLSDGAGRLFVADSVHLIINNFAYTPKDSLYSFRVKKLMASYSDSTLLLDSFSLVPNYTKREFAKEVKKQTDRFKISAKKVVFNKIDVKLLFERNIFLSEKLDIDSLSLSAYRDKNDIRKPQRAKSLQQILKNLPIYSVIDTIRLNNAGITYEEVAPGSAKPGRVSFNSLNATITGFTSDSTLFSKFNILKVDATCMLMDKGRLQAQYLFPLNTDKTEFECSGTLTDMPMTAMNPMLEPNAKVSMKEGIIDSMVFSFFANEYASKGKMKFVYHNLKMEILNKEGGKTGFLEQAKTFFAHLLIIKESNPTGKNPVRLTEISYPRDPTRFIFNYSWKSIYSGIKPAISPHSNK